MTAVRRTPRRIIRGLMLALRSPADGWLMARMLAWRAVLPALKHLMPLPRLVALMDAGPPAQRRCRGREQRIAALAERVFDVTRSDQTCLDRSLVTYRYLIRSGGDPRLVIAVRKDGAVTRGHAWVTVGGVPVHDSTALLENFTSLMTFGPGHAAQHPRGTDANS